MRRGFMAPQTGPIIAISSGYFHSRGALHMSREMTICPVSSLRAVDDVLTIETTPLPTVSLTRLLVN